MHTVYIDSRLLGGQDFAEEQNLVARMVHQLRSDDPDEHFQILKTARRHFSSGGPRRVRHTLPPLAFSALQVLLSSSPYPHACHCRHVCFNHAVVHSLDTLHNGSHVCWYDLTYSAHSSIVSAFQPVTS